MGEEQKEEEQKEQEEKKAEGAEEKKEEENKEEKKEEETPEVVLKVDMHCEGCARKVERSLRRFEGIEDVKTDSRSRTVVVKGKGADPIKVCERIQKKTGKKVELISPLPKPPEEEKKDEPPQEEKKEEPKVITVVLKVRMHCDACAQVLQRRIKKMDGVESVATDLPNDQVIVKGMIDPVKLVENVYRRTRKQASIVQGEEKKEEEKKEERKEEEKEEEGEGEKKEEKENGEDDKKIDVKKYEYWPFRYSVEYAYPPQIFSDENPNACTIM